MKKPEIVDLFLKKAFSDNYLDFNKFCINLSDIEKNTLLEYKNLFQENLLISIFSCHENIILDSLKLIGFSPDVKKSNGKNILINSIINNQLNLFNYLISQKVSVNNLENSLHSSPLMFACEQTHDNSFYMIKTLLENGAEINQTNEFKTSALLILCASKIEPSKKIKSLMLLKEFNANPLIFNLMGDNAFSTLIRLETPDVISSAIWNWPELLSKKIFEDFMNGSNENLKPTVLKAYNMSNINQNINNSFSFHDELNKKNKI